MDKVFTVDNEMAFDFGFSDQAAFTKFFIRMKGESPRNYRKKDSIIVAR